MDFKMTNTINILYDPTDVNNFFYEDNTGKYSSMWKVYKPVTN